MTLLNFNFITWLIAQDDRGDDISKLAKWVSKDKANACSGIGSDAVSLKRHLERKHPLLFDQYMPALSDAWVEYVERDPLEWP